MRQRAVITCVAAVWFAIAVGLAQGTSFLLFQNWRWLNWSAQIIPVDAHILWAAPTVNVTVFLLAGLFLFILCAGFRRLPWEATSVGFFAALGTYTLFSLSERLQDQSVMLLALGVGSVAFRWTRRAPERRFGFLRRSVGALAAAYVLTILVVVVGGRLWESYQIRRLPAPPSNAPNVLLIVLDTVRADRLGAYGYARARTPFLDRFSSQGARFENAIATSSWTLPSHATLFTGRFPYEHGAMLNSPLDERFPTVAETLAANGYATAGFAANNGVLTEAFGLARGFHHWEGIFYSAFDSARRTVLGRKLQKTFVRWADYDRRLEHLQAPEVNERFLTWLEAHRNQRFFAFLNLMEAHDPDITLARDVPLVSWGRRKKDERFEHLNEAYDASLTYLDSELEHLFDRLRERKLDDNLLVIITADHGESLGERGLRNHRTSLYLEQIRVPLLIRFPSKVFAGSVVHRPVSLRDIPATLLAEIIPGGSPHPGHSLLGLLSEESSEISPALSEVEGTPYAAVPKEWPTAQGWVSSEVTPDWQFILQENGKVELFAAPRYSANTSGDLAGAREFQELVDQFRAHLQSLQRAADRH